MEKAPIQQNHQKTVLIVDDDPEILKLVSAVMLDGNYNVLTASSGDAAVCQSKGYKTGIDLLLSDFQMSGMDGVDLATRIAAERPDIKVLLMSGFPLGMLVLNEGWHFLPKPFIASQLRLLVSGLIPHKATE